VVNAVYGKSQDSSVGTVTRLPVGHPRNQAWFYFWQGQQIFSTLKCPELFGIPPVLLNGYQDSSAGGKAVGARTWPLTSI